MDAGSNGLSPKIGQSGRGKGSEAAYLDKPGFLVHYISSRRQPGGRGAVSSQSTGQDSGLSKFLTQLIAAIGGLGILTYAILWFGYTRFYGHFHVPLRDVGLDYKAVLGQSATMIALLSLGALFGVGAAWLARSRMRWWAGIPLVLLASVAVGVLLGSLFVLNNDGIRKVESGKGLPHVKLAGVILLDLQVTPVNRLDIKKDNRQDLEKNKSLMYFGQANGFVVLYDFTEGTIYRIPSNAINEWS
jgi:hypothetical protein